jgi:hypothetical protein
MSSVTIRILGHDLPGLRCAGLPGISRPVYDGVHVGVQRKHDVVEMIPGDAPEACWTLQVDVVPGRDGGLDVRGPWAHGKPGERFLYLSWGERDALGHFQMFRRAKLSLTTIGDDLLQRALDSGAAIEGRLGLSDKHGHPLCASVRPPAIAWSLAT